jgi:cytochrome b involved in lipid metabolism
MAFFGLAYNLHRFPANEISKSRYQMDAKRLAKTKKSIDWGPAPIALPLMTLEQVAAEAKATPPRQLIVLDDIVYDIAEFAPNHPGGKIINIYLGRDATEAFDGGVYAHSNAARNLLDTMRVARLPTLKTNNKVIKSNNNHVGREDDESTVAETWLVEHAAYGEHGPLAHLNAARMQGTPIEKSPYEIDFPIQAGAGDKKTQ